MTSTPSSGPVHVRPRGLGREPSNRLGSRGFSLLEVLVAFTIMAFALGALYQSMGMSVRTMQRVENQSRAAVVASSVLSLYLLAPREGINQQGTSPDGFRWSAMSQPYSPQIAASPVRKLQELKVEVSWMEGSAPSTFSVQTLIPEVAE